MQLLALLRGFRVEGLGCGGCQVEGFGCSFLRSFKGLRLRV